MKSRMLWIMLIFGLMPFLQANHLIEKDSDGSILVRLHLPSLAEDGDSNLATEFLFRAACLQLSDGERANMSLSTSHEGAGELEFKGSEAHLAQFFEAFCVQIEKILDEGLSQEKFDLVKEAYLQELKNVGVLTQVDQVEELTLEEVNHYRALLRPMLRSMSQLFHGMERLRDWGDLVDRKRERLPFQRTELHDATPDIILVNQQEGSRFQPYYQLRLFPQDCRNIDQLIEYLSQPWYKLMRKAGKVNALGDQIRPVHPLRFLGYILSKSDLKKKLRKDIRSSSIVWRKFINGFGDTMARESRNKNIDQYVPGFCQHLGVSEHHVNSYIRSHNWEGLVKSLL